MSHRRYAWPNDPGIDFDAFGSWHEVATELSEHHDALVIANVYAYDHSGIAFKTGERTYPFNDMWDSGVAGLAYVTNQNWQEAQGTPWTGSEADLEQAHKLIADDVDLYGQWANGECYGFRITDEAGEVVQSCWGIIGYEWVKKEAELATEGQPSPEPAPHGH